MSIKQCVSPFEVALMKLCLGHFQLFHNCWYLSFYSELRLWVRVVKGGDLVYSHPKNLSGAISFIVSSEKNFEKLKVREGAWLEREKGNCHRKQVGRLKGCIFYSSKRAILRHRVRIRATTLDQDDTNPYEHGFGCRGKKTTMLHSWLWSREFKSFWLKI